jgi:hypothetical protein
MTSAQEQAGAVEVDHARLREVIDAYLAPYFARNSTAAKAIEAVKGIHTTTKNKDDGNAEATGASDHLHNNLHHVHWDHLAFRTFGADGCGIDSIAKVFTVGGLYADSCRIQLHPSIA